MLQNLHVKNLALINEIEVEFKDGLNILSGETGAGKSIIIGSINLALGEKVQKEMLRDNADTALVELVFYVIASFVNFWMNWISRILTRRSVQENCRFLNMK